MFFNLNEISQIICAQYSQLNLNIRRQCLQQSTG